MTTLNDIEQKAKAFADKREQLASRVARFNARVERLKAKALPSIKQAAAEAAVAYDELHAEIKAAPALFSRPRTVALHGIKLGYRQSTGSLEIADPKRTCELIAKHLPEQEEQLVETTRKPIKDAIARLPAAELKRIGVQVIPGADVVVIKPADGALDAVVAALIKAEIEEPGA